MLPTVRSILSNTSTASIHQRRVESFESIRMPLKSSATSAKENHLILPSSLLRTKKAKPGV